MAAIEGGSCVRGDIDRAQYLAAGWIEGVQFVSGRKPDVLAVIGDAMHAFDAGKGSIFMDDGGCCCVHASILASRQRSGE
jgi:hypothetical protein